MIGIMEMSLSKALSDFGAGVNEKLMQVKTSQYYIDCILLHKFMNSFHYST